MSYGAKAAAAVLALVAVVTIYVVVIGIKTWQQRDNQPPVSVIATLPPRQ